MEQVHNQSIDEISEVYEHDSEDQDFDEIAH